MIGRKIAGILREHARPVSLEKFLESAIYLRDINYLIKDSYLVLHGLMPSD